MIYAFTIVFDGFCELSDKFFCVFKFFQINFKLNVFSQLIKSPFIDIILCNNSLKISHFFCRWLGIKSFKNVFNFVTQFYNLVHFHLNLLEFYFVNFRYSVYLVVYWICNLFPKFLRQVFCNNDAFIAFNFEDLSDILFKRLDSLINEQFQRHELFQGNVELMQVGHLLTHTRQFIFHILGVGGDRHATCCFN